MKVWVIDEFNRVIEGAVLFYIVNFEIPDDGSKENNRQLYEEIHLLLYSDVITVEYYFVGIIGVVGYILHKGWVDGIIGMVLA